MKVQITAKVETYVTIEVEVADDSPNTIEKAMNEVMTDTGTDLVHEKIVEVTLGERDVVSYRHSLTFTGCDCGVSTDLEPEMIKED